MPAFTKATLRAMFAEFCATALFVFFGAGSVSAAVAAAGPAVQPVNYALSFGFAITILAFAVGDVSGAHINPSVTLALAITKNIEPMRAVLYVISQIVGGLVGGGLLRLAVGDAYRSGIGLSPLVQPGGGFLLELMGTLILIFVVFNVAVWTTNVAENDFGGTVISSLAPIPIGLAVLVAHLTLGPFTGCGINPARVLGAVVYEDGFWDSRAGENFWIYWVGPFLASFIAPLTYLVMEGTLHPGSAGHAKPAKVHAGEESTPVQPFK